ncbi:MAG: SDR family NAD(P)-dependent oxidoreductase [Nannocystales bacterium]
MSNPTKTALITGANSGVGFEAARLLGLDPSYGRVYLAVRSQAKGVAARSRLAQLCGCDEGKFEVLTIDVSSAESTREALGLLFAARPELKFDYVLLNAGRVGGVELERTADSIDVAYAATLVGHHIIALDVLDRGALRSGATIVIAGAEAARGTLSGMTLRDVHALASERYEGDLSQATTALLRGEAPGTYDARGDLATLKAFAVWWAAALARRLESRHIDAKVFSVSPGGTPETNGPQYLPFPMRVVLKILTPILKLAGQAHSVPKAAQRYIDVLSRPTSDSGKFFASPHEKGIGALTDNTALYGHFRDEALQEAVFASLQQVTGASMELHPRTTAAAEAS